MQGHLEFSRIHARWLIRSCTNTHTHACTHVQVIFLKEQQHGQMMVSPALMRMIGSKIDAACDASQMGTEVKGR